MKKRLITLVMTLALLLSALPVTTAASTPQIQPRWTNTVMVYTHLTFSGSEGVITASITGRPNVSNITVEIKLYYKNIRGNWIDTHNSWTYSVDDMSFEKVERFNAVAGREYKAVFTATVYKDGYGEVVSDYATGTCPSN